MSSNISEKEKYIGYIKNLVYNCDMDKLLELEEDVINRNISELSYWYAYKVDGVDIDKHENIVIDSRDLIWNYLFVRDVRQASIKGHEDVIVNSGDAYYNYLFAKDIKGADVKKLGEVVFLSKDPEYNYLFALL